ncbi:MAG TPA: hypothetical protein EYP85_12635 [Armatimonadetes bacterium]|nr:hypothetical protein [Armatimonadota bacterium]
MRTFVLIGLLLLLLGSEEVGAKSLTYLRCLAALPLEQSVLQNGDLEQVAEGKVAVWEPWEEGYTVDQQVAHTGRRSARCESRSPEVEYGLGQTVVLNQKRPQVIMAEAWSRAENVSGSPDSGYSLYLDLIYTDGTPLWGQVAPFDCGTHDWQKRRVTVVPEKPVREVRVYGIFRRHTGRVWFDDFRLAELSLTSRPPLAGGRRGVATFDGVPVTGEVPSRQVQEPMVLRTGDGLTMTFDAATGQLVSPTGRVGGFLLRDVAAKSDFRQPVGRLERRADGFRLQAKDEELQLALEVTAQVQRDHLAFTGVLSDRRGDDRAVTVCFVWPVEALGWTWSDEVRTHRPIEAGQPYGNFVFVGCGATGQASRYPLAALSGPQEGLALAVPLDTPRLVRLAYEGQQRLYYAAFDLGLSADTKKFPSRASFRFLAYRFDPAWRFRAALARYYRLLPHLFVKRVAREGIWMPFTDIATVEGFEDFGFAFHEGNNNVPFDEEHDIYSFVYVEPMSHWLPLPAQVPRTLEAALAHLQRRAGEGNQQAIATYSSGLQDEQGRWVVSFHKAPWCDGALFLLNPDPDLPAPPDYPLSQFAHEWQRIETAFRSEESRVAGWQPWGGGYSAAPSEGRGGSQALKCSRQAPSRGQGASQVVALHQKQPRPLVATAWSRAEGVTGEPDRDYALYLDLTFADGSHLWGQTAPFAVGTHDWQQVTVRVEPPKPIATVAYHLLFRGNHTGTVWFDNASLKEEGRDRELLTNPACEPEAARPAVLDGVYIDSLEMGSRALDFRREHWVSADVPLVFDTHTARPARLLHFCTYEFAAEVGRRMHEQGKLLFANSALIRFPWPAAVLDILGIETNWAPGGQYTPNSDAIMNYRRALCYQRPYLLLLNTVYDRFPREWVEKYFKRCAFYAIFPSMFSHNAATDRYWERPNLYNRDRALFREYIPLIQTLAAAGWEPLTWARTDRKEVYVERYGHPPTVYLTLFNDSDVGHSFSLRVDLEALGFGGRVRIESLRPAEAVLGRAEGKWEWGGELGPEDLLVLRLQSSQ